MSGIEVAGLLLGALPLVISAIEHYESNLDRAMAFFKWRDELEKAMRELWMQHLSYELTLRNLLQDVASVTELDEMMSNAQSSLWKSKELAGALQDKLGVAYNVYMYNVKEMEAHLKTLARHLDLDRQKMAHNELEAIIIAARTVPSSSSGPPKFEFRRRIKFTMKRKDIRLLLTDLKDCNERLEQFIEKANKFEDSSIQPTTSKSHLSMPLQQISEYASSLHEVLKRTWSCSSHPNHQAHLLLEHRMIRKKKRRQLKASTKSDPSTFTITFRDNAIQSATWRFAEVRVSEEEPAPAPSSKSPGGRVAFVLAPPTAGPGGLPLSPATPELEVIHNLCSAFQNKTNHDSYLGFRLDHQGSLRGTFPPCKESPSLTDTLVSLDDLLFSESKQWHPLTDEERYILAITLVSSFLQLHSTPWLGTRWSEHDILFPERKVDSRRMVDAKFPFVMKTYTSEQPTTQQSKPPPPKPPTTTISTPYDESHNLLTLAKLLLEIRFSNRVENMRQKEDLGLNAVLNETTDLQTLKRWMLQEKGNLSFAFRDAIGYCMKCFADPSTNLKDPAFRQSVIDSVVVPLLEELYFWQDGRL